MKKGTRHLKNETDCIIFSALELFIDILWNSHKKGVKIVPKGQMNRWGLGLHQKQVVMDGTDYVRTNRWYVVQKIEYRDNMDQDHGHRLNNFGWDHRRAWIYPQIKYISSIEYIQSSLYFYLLASFGWSVTVYTIAVPFFFKFELLKTQLFGNFQMSVINKWARNEDFFNYFLFDSVNEWHDASCQWMAWCFLSSVPV